MPSSIFGRHRLPEWPLDPDITYLNHGTVGVAPRRVLAAQQAIRDAIERQPSRFLLRELSEVGVGEARRRKPRMRESADAVAPFLGARGDDLVFVDNATTGATAVFQSLGLKPGEELLVSDLGYGGITRAAMAAARAQGAACRTVEMPYPVRSAGDLVAAWTAAITPSTRVAVVDHISAESALVFPLAEIAERLRSRGVAVFADGAHAPGAIAVDIASLGVDWYVGNLHKWAWAPRSSAILWAGPDRQRSLHSPIPSWGLDQGFTAEFGWPGTRDPSPHLTAPAAFELMEEWDVESVQRYNHELAWQGARLLAGRWSVTFDTPEELIGPMATVALPQRLGSTREDATRLRNALLFEDRIEVQVHAFREQLYVRISTQIYNDLTDVERLAAAVESRLSAMPRGSLKNA